MTKLTKIIIPSKWLLYSLFSFLIILLCILLESDVIIMAVVLLILGIFLFCMQDIGNRSVLLGFFVAFFTFLIGRQFMEMYHIVAIQTTIDESINKQVELILLISIISLLLGYWISGKIKVFHKRMNETDYKSVLCQCIRSFSKIGFLITYPFMIISLIEVIRFVGTSSYLDYYTSFQSSLPFFIEKLGEMCLVFFYTFLASMPKKKEGMLYIVLYLFYLAVSLLTGRRYEFVGGLLVLFVYFAIRGNTDKTDEVWFGKNEKIMAILVLIGVIIVSTIIGKTRLGANDDNLGSNFLLNFFYQQGVSVNVIKRTIQYSDSLNPNRVYMFGSVINLFRSYLGLPTFTGNSIDNALNGYSLAHALSYIVLGNQYLLGRGMGSSYIAEAFYSFGYLGVIATNFFYGLLLKRISSFTLGTVWKNAIVLIILHSLFLAPRSNFDGFLTEILRFNTWGTLILIFIVSKLMLSRRKRRKA